MKKFFYQLSIVLLTVSLTATSSLFAQQTENSNPEKTVIITIVTKDGQTITKKITVPEGEMPSNFDALDGIDAENIASIDVDVLDKDCKVRCTPGCGNKDFNFKKGKSSFRFDGWNSEEFAAKREAMRKRRKAWKHNFGESQKPMLGVYVDESHDGQGMKIDNVIQGKGAIGAGLERGDVITHIGKSKVSEADDIAEILKGSKIGDSVKVKYTRDGVAKSGTIVLSSSSVRPRFKQRYFDYRRDEKPDPCKVFIGVYTKNRNEGGVQVTRIIDGTAAADMDLKNGDIILALDGEEVNSQPELVIERDENQPGDYFKLTILRDGKRKKVRGQFKACEEKPEVTDILQPKIIDPSSQLKYQAFEAFPNPTFGEVNISFEGEAVPTTFRVTDVSGKVVFQEELENFDGIYKKQIQLKNRAVPGAISLTVIQNGQAVSKNIVLLNRA